MELLSIDKSVVFHFIYQCQYFSCSNYCN